MKKPIHFLFASFLIIALPGLLSAQDNHFDYMDVFDLQMVGNPQISPDGNTIIYQRHQYDVKTDRGYSNIWRISFSGEKHEALTSGKNSYGNVSWSPNGSKITYTSSEEGSSQIFIRWMESGETTSLTNLDKSPGSVQWSPNGSMILFTKQIEADKPSIGSFPGAPEGMGSPC